MCSLFYNPYAQPLLRIYALLACVSSHGMLRVGEVKDYCMVCFTLPVFYFRLAMPICTFVLDTSVYSISDRCDCRVEER